MQLIEKNLPYSPNDLKKWINRDFTIFDNRIPSHIKNFLIKKANNRNEKNQKKRLFSEVMTLNFFIEYVIDNVVWYSSFKWLSAHKWLTGATENNLENRFYKDINRNFKFGKREEINVAFIQNKAKDFKSRDKGKLLGFTKNGKVRNPTAPDIWLKHKDEGLIFIESKREEDLAPTQIAGIALIMKYFHLPTYVIRFYSDTLDEPTLIDHTTDFMEFYKSV